MKKCLSLFLLFFLFFGTASFSYAQDDMDSFFNLNPWNDGRTGSDSPSFGLGAFNPDSADGLPRLGNFDAGRDNDPFGLDAFFNDFLDVDTTPDRELVSPFNISETAGNVTVQVHVAPGTELDDIAVTPDGGLLSINVQNTEILQETEEDHSYIEWHHESFSRTAVLPGDVQTQEMTTEYDDGVLTVTFPKSQ